MEILGNFGFEPILFLAQIVNFLIIFFLLKRFLYKPMVKMLDERKKTIADGLKFAEEADKKLQETIEKEETILKKAQQEARKLIEETKVEQEEFMRKTEESAHLRVEKMLQDAREQINFETAEAEKRLSAQVSRLAVQFLQQAVGDLFGSQEQEMIMKNALKKLQKKAD